MRNTRRHGIVTVQAVSKRFGQGTCKVANDLDRLHEFRPRECIEILLWHSPVPSEVLCERWQRSKTGRGSEQSQTNINDYGKIGTRNGDEDAEKWISIRRDVLWPPIRENSDPSGLLESPILVGGAQRYLIRNMKQRAHSLLDLPGRRKLKAVIYAEKQVIKVPAAMRNRKDYKRWI